MPLNMKEIINYKYIAIGILIGYLSPYVLALISSYFSPSQLEKAPAPKQSQTNSYEY